MTIPFQLQYMREKAKQENEEELRQKENRSIAYEKFDRSVQTRTSTIPDMSSAYAQVRNSGHTPTEEEIHFRRFTSGSVMDGSKRK
jgi:hypothetical protein